MAMGINNANVDFDEALWDERFLTGHPDWSADDEEESSESYASDEAEEDQEELVPVKRAAARRKATAHHNLRQRKLAEALGYDLELVKPHQVKHLVDHCWRVYLHQCKAEVVSRDLAREDRKIQKGLWDDDNFDEALNENSNDDFGEDYYDEDDYGYDEDFEDDYGFEYDYDDDYDGFDYFEDDDVYGYDEGFDEEDEDFGFDYDEDDDEDFVPAKKRAQRRRATALHKKSQRKLAKALGYDLEAMKPHQVKHLIQHDWKAFCKRSKQEAISHDLAREDRKIHKGMWDEDECEPCTSTAQVAENAEEDSEKFITAFERVSKMSLMDILTQEAMTNRHPNEFFSEILGLMMILVYDEIKNI